MTPDATWLAVSLPSFPSPFSLSSHKQVPDLDEGSVHHPSTKLLAFPLSRNGTWLVSLSFREDCSPSTRNGLMSHTSTSLFMDQVPLQLSPHLPLEFPGYPATKPFREMEEPLTSGRKTLLKVSWHHLRPRRERRRG